MHRNGEVEKHSIALEAATDITKEYTALKLVVNIIFSIASY
jgi:hypothetical protein